ncbi:MAG: DUF3329 domain-containing protein, partial [Aquabacterium sp.]|uniref:phosphate regulon sensor protein PhoR n=1 Tax=Aquabacterium sp. TaxID=1872578 RepID=UPI0012180C5C
MDTSDSWLLSRVGARLLAASAGGFAGWWIGKQIGYPVTTGMAAAASAVLLLSVNDTLKGHRLLDWLRTPEAAPPDLPGMWGEVAHRVQRVVHLKDVQIGE